MNPQRQQEIQQGLALAVAMCKSAHSCARMGSMTTAVVARHVQDAIAQLRQVDEMLRATDRQP
jgi:hypothetical protein